MQFLSKVGGRPAVAAIALVGVMMMAGCAGSSLPGNNVTATPAFSPAGGTYNSSQTVTIGDSTKGAVMYCTTDGTMPTTSSPQCSQPTTVFKTEFLQAMAVAPGMAGSPTVAAGYIIDLSAAASPTFSPAGGTYNSSQTLTITDATAGANIYYTTDGTPPTASSTLYTVPISISKAETISAIAVASAYSNSGVASAAYVISAGSAPPPSGGTPSTTVAPTFSPAAGTYSSSQTVTLSDATAGATIYYTTDGSTPTASSKLYSAPITVTQSETVSAIAIAAGTSSAVATGAYSIGAAGTPPPSTTATPTFSPAAGTYSSSQTVTLSDATAGATIYYTANGSTPTASSTQYSGPIAVAQTETISAIAIAAGKSSSVATAAYTISAGGTPPPPGGSGSTAAPTFSPSGGTFTTAQAVTISDTTPGATITYTTDGSDPNFSNTGTTYSVPITVSQSDTIKAIAIAAGRTSTSSIAQATFTIFLGGIPAPTISPSGGTFGAAQTVTLTDSATAASLFYTADGSTPTASSTLYTGPITVSVAETLKAIAVVGGDSSVVSTAAFAFGSSSLGGSVLSGSSPVAGAQVQLYAAGQSGYGSAATALLVTPVTTDASGSFTAIYNCPASPGDLVYLVATGGNAGAGINSGLELMTALGPCGGLNGATPVVVNEVTTVASAYALSPFMTTAPNVGSSGSSAAYAGLKNAFATVSNLVNLGNGHALTITPAYAASPVPFLNSSTVPQKRIDTLANILNACASSNGTGGGCANLYNNTAGTGAVPANTLQAILNIAQSPGTHAASLFGLASPTGPFQPALSAAPNDWTLALTFTGAGLGFAPGTTAMDPLSNPVVNIVNSALAIDANGNVFVTAYATDGFGDVDFGGGMITEFNSLGAPVTPATTLSVATPAVLTPGGFLPGTQSSLEPDVIAIDSSGNLWVGSGDFHQGLLEISDSSSGLSVAQDVSALGIMSVQSIAFDTTGNVWVGGLSTALGGGVLGELDTSGNVNANFGFFGANGMSAANSNGFQELQQLTFDSTGVLWGTDSNAISTGGGDVYQINQSDGTIAFDPFFNPAISTSSAVYTPLVADGSGNVYGCASIDPTTHKGGQSVNVFNAASTSFNTISIATGRGCGNQMAMDGLGHIFAVTGDPGSHGVGSPGVGVIDEFKTDGTLISPSTGYTGTSSGESRTINPDPSLILPSTAPPIAGVAGVAVDGSGNLWVLNIDTGASSATAGNVLVQYVGIAAPVVTPIASALTNGQMAARP